MKKLLKKINVKFLLFVVLLTISLVLFAFNIIKSSFVYSFPAFFELCILLLKKIKFKKFLYFNRLEVIKNIILFLVLSIGVFNGCLFLNNLVLKISLTALIVIEIIIFLRYNAQKTKK